jgi:hypothetical protein
VDAATHLYKDHWTLEYSVPLKDMGLDPAQRPVARINIVRDRYKGYTGEISSWFPVAYSTADLNVRAWGLFQDKER